MNKQSVKTSSGDLFARKGSAKPAGHLIAYERIVPSGDRPDPAERSDVVKAFDDADPARGDDLESDLADEGGTTAGSLFSIEFRKQDTEAEVAKSHSVPGPPSREVPSSPASLQRKISASLQDPETERRKPLRFSTPTDHVAETAEPAASASLLPRNRRDEASRQGAIAALVAVFCLMVGAWFAFEHWGGKTTETPDAAVPPAETAAGGSLEPADADKEEPALAAAPAAAVQPSFDLIRVEPDGEAVIAGRAEPNAELILLDNGEPIGTITANWAGEWAFIPETPLEPGNHQFSLVVKTPQGTVTLPAPGEDASVPQAQGQDRLPGEATASEPSETPGAAVGAPGGGAGETGPVAPESSSPAGAGPAAGETSGQSGAGSGRQSGVSAQDPPVPPHKPAPKELAALGDGGAAHYMIQLSSTHSQAGAQKEWVKLRRIFPELLDGMELNVHKAKVDPLGTRYRVRTGQFADEDHAQALCRKFQSLDQECLVIKR